MDLHSAKNRQTAEKACNSLICLAKITATRRDILRVRNFSSAVCIGLNSLVRASCTTLKCHRETKSFLGGHSLHTPFRN